MANGDQSQISSSRLKRRSHHDIPSLQHDYVTNSEYVATIRALLYRVRAAELVFHVQHATLDRELDGTSPRATVLSKQALEDLLESK